MPRKVFERLADSAATDLKSFLDQCETHFCEMDDEALALDIDRQEDYERAVRLYLKASE